MGCVSSHLLSNEDELAQLGSSAMSHHIVSLTSSTYGLITLDPTTPPTAPRFEAITSRPMPDSKPLWSEPRPIRPCPEVINSWELMADLDVESFRVVADKENSNPNNRVSRPKSLSKRFETSGERSAGEKRVVIYTTSLRGVRRTFEDCNAVRAAIEGFGVSICERDVSMDRGFREELRELMRGSLGNEMRLPQVFVRGKHVGGAEEILGFVDEGLLGEILQGLPKRNAGTTVCEGCAGVRFLPCFHCSGSCKVVMSRTLVVRCSHCNENGLVLCPICT